MGLIARIISVVAGFIVGTILLRFLFLLFGANPLNGFVHFIYSFTKPFVAPFVGIFGSNPAISGQHIFEWASVIAIIVYTLAASLLVTLLTPRHAREI